MNGREYLALVGSLPCVLCARIGHVQSSRTTVHHIRDGHGMQERAAEYAVAFCAQHGVELSEPAEVSNG